MMSIPTRVGSYLKNNKSIVAVVLISVLFSIAMGIGTWHMNFWPSDTEVYYFDVALKVPHMKYVAQMHDMINQERVKWLHGKEIYILAASVFQQLLHDSKTLRPFLIVCIFAIFASAVLIYLIAQRYWGRKVGWILYLLFINSFWPYIYILFTKHQPLGLFFILLAVYCLQIAGTSRFRGTFYFLSGISLASAMFSSSTSAVYIPYYAVAFSYQALGYFKKTKQWIDVIKSAGMILLGAVVIYVYVNFPFLIRNFGEYMEYVHISGRYNHFFYNQRVLEQWLPAHELKARGGWLWIIKYFLLIMPVVFPLYIAAVVYLIVSGIRGKKLNAVLLIAGIIILSLSAAILAEIKQVAQYGANYFPCFIGILTLIGFTVHRILNGAFKQWPSWAQRVCIRIALLIGLLQVGINGYWFFTDIYPSRMVTTILADKIDKLGVDRFYTYRRHPYRLNIIDNMTNSLFTVKKVKVILINHLPEAMEGYVVVPPITGDTIYNAATSFYTDFDEDVYLDEIMHKGNYKDYAVASYPTLGSSRFWPHEEEILSYRYLILGQREKNFDERGRVWILDAKKMFHDIEKNIPSRDLIFMSQNEIKNVGAKSRIFVFNGYEGKIKSEMDVGALAFRMYKVGEPKDQLIARVYKVDKKQLVWVPVSDKFQSYPLEGAELSSDPRGNSAIFHFAEPLHFEPGPYYVTIYRTGPWDDSNYYRIYDKYIGTAEVTRK